MADQPDGPDVAGALVSYDPAPLATAIHDAILAYWKTQGVDASTDDDVMLKIKTLASLAANVAGIAGTHPDHEQPLGMFVAFVRALLAVEGAGVVDVIVGTRPPRPGSTKH